MSKEIIIKNDVEINVINDLIHDCWFSKDAIFYDKLSSSLTIRYRRELSDKKKTLWKKYLLKRYSIPIVEFILQFKYVINYKISNGKNAESWDIFNKINFLPNDRKILVKTCIATTFEIVVDNFYISIMETDNIVGDHKKWTISLNR
ncbi:MAG: hypothetical protein JW927_18460 [Deltaproteobacteria bacterium]|nr:hypothetical protein [Deltaproteobacteria bacterium]